MIVVDTNVIAYLWRSEFENVLTGFIRRGHIPLNKALAIMEQAEGQMRGAEYHVDSSDVLLLVKQSPRIFIG